MVCCGADAAEQKRCTACARTQCRGVVEACVLLPAPAGSCLLQLPRLLAPSCALKLDPSPSRGMSSCIAAIPPSGQLPLRRRFFCKFPFLSIRGAAIPPSGQLPLRGRFFFFKEPGPGRLGIGTNFVLASWAAATNSDIRVLLYSKDSVPPNLLAT